MAKTLTPPRAGIPLASVIVGGAQYDAQINPEWLRYMQGLFDRAGGTSGPSTSDLSESAYDDAGTEETKAGLYRLEQDIGQFPAAFAAPPEDFVSTLADLREQIPVLRADLEGLRQGILV
jgi:hypothetical protein